MNIGSMTTLIITAPLAEAFGWRTALVLWSVLALVAALAWLTLVGWRAFLLGSDTETGHAARGTGLQREAASRQGGVAAVPAPAAADRPGWRMPAAWILLIAFSGQAFAFYAVSTWLPTLLSDVAGLGATAAGAGASLFQGPGIAGALAVPLLSRRLRSRTLLWLTCAAWAALPLGLLLAPSGWAVWVTVGGVAQGAGITVIFLILVRLGGSTRQAGQVSALVQGGGYLVAAAGPVILGSLNTMTGSWVLPLAAVGFSIAALLVAGTLAAVESDAAGRSQRRVQG